jgi:hypothetical protein
MIAYLIEVYPEFESALLCNCYYELNWNSVWDCSLKSSTGLFFSDVFCSTYRKFALVCVEMDVGIMPRERDLGSIALRDAFPGNFEEKFRSSAMVYCYN